jgi:hypothetical protein
MRLKILVLIAFLAYLSPTVVAQECVIELGGGGRTHAYRADLLPGRARSWESVPESDFIRRTSGPCTFTVYNGNNFGGRFVTLGSNLGERIRAGIDGVRYKDEGGGATWRIRSLKILRQTNTDCRLSIGGGGVRMDYYASADVIPAMDRVGGFFGGNCAAEIWNGEHSGRDDPYKRFKSLHPSGPREPAYDPGFRVRSIVLRDYGGYCEEIAKDQGRCLPRYRLASSIYATSDAYPDRDGDQLADRLENILAEAFRPIYVNDSEENATRVNIFTTAAGDRVMEPVTIFQVRPDEHADQLLIVFMKLWRHDEGGAGCPGHEGDTQLHSVHLKTTGRGTPDYGKFWYVFQTGGGSEGDLNWEQGDGSLRGVTFERWGSEAVNNHLVIHFTRGKHHEYADGGWSGQKDNHCTATAYINGMGRLHRPPYPKRIAVIRAPVSAPRGFGGEYANVGSRRVPFFDDLTPYGFPRQRVWSGSPFYSVCVPPENACARPVDRGFR